MSADLLRRAAAKLRETATAAADLEAGERWMVDQSTENGLVVGSFVPEDVDDDGVASTGCIAYFAYPGEPEAKTYDGAFNVATHMATVDPAAAAAMADLLDALAPYLGLNRPAWSVADHAIAVARAVLREDGESSC